MNNLKFRIELRNRQKINQNSLNIHLIIYYMRKYIENNSRFSFSIEYIDIDEEFFEFGIYELDEFIKLYKSYRFILTNDERIFELIEI